MKALKMVQSSPIPNRKGQIWPENELVESELSSMELDWGKGHFQICYQGKSNQPDATISNNKLEIRKNIREEIDITMTCMNVA